MSRAAQRAVRQPEVPALNIDVDCEASAQTNLNSSDVAAETRPYPGEHEAVHVNVEIGGRAEAPDQPDGVAVSLADLAPGAVQQMARDDTAPPEAPT